MTNTFDTVYNSTLGLPYQVLMRTARALFDEDKDLFSRDGLLDPALLPVAGMFFDHSRDASGRDFTDSAAGAFAIDIFADPTTYMSAGLTAAGKGARTLSKLTNTSAFREAIVKGTVSRETPVSEIMKMAGDAYASGSFAGSKQAKLLRNAESLEPFGDMSFADLINRANQTELAVAIPGLSRLGFRRVVPSQHKSWFSLMGAANGKAWRGAATATGARHIPGVRSVLKKADEAYTSLKSGLKTPIIADQSLGGMQNAASIESVEAAQEVMVTGGRGEEVLAGLTQDLYEKVYNSLDDPKLDIADRFDKWVEMEGDTATAILRAVGERVPADAAARQMQAERVMRAMTGSGNVALPQEGAKLKNIAMDFLEQQDEARDILSGPELYEELADVKGRGTRLFEAGQGMRKWWRKVFVSDLGAENLDEFEKMKRSYEAAAQESVQSMARDMYLERPEIAAEIFPDADNAPEQFDSFMRNLFEAHFAPEEITHAALNGGTFEGAQGMLNSMENMLSRSFSASNTMAKVLARGGYEGAADLRLHLNRIADYPVGVYADRVVERMFAKGQLPDHVLNGPKVQLHRLRSEGASKDLLVHLTDDDLQAQLKSLKKPGMRKALEGDVQEVINKHEDLLELQEELGVTTKRFSAMMRSSRAGKKPRGMDASQVSRLHEAVAGFSAKEIRMLEGAGKVFDPALVDANRFYDIAAVEDTMRLRADGAIRPVPKPKDVPLESHVDMREIGDELFGGADDAPLENLSDFQQSYYRMAALVGEAQDYVRRAKDAGVARPSFKLMQQFEGMSARWNATLMNTAEAAMGKSGKRYFKGLREMQKSLAVSAFKNGLAGQGSYPLGYLPRILSGNAMQALRQLGNGMPREVAEQLAPQRGAEFARALDSMTLDQINDVSRQLVSSGRPKLAKKLDDILESEGVKLDLFEEDPTAAFVTAMGEMEDATSNADFLNRVIKNHGEKTMMVGGKVVGFVDDKSRPVFLEAGKKFDYRLGGRKVQVGAADHQPRQRIDYRAMLIQDQNTNKVVAVPSSMVGNGFSLLGLGNKGEDVGQAFSHTIAQGAANKSRFNAMPSLEQLADMAGHSVLFGNDANLGAVLNSTQLTQTYGADVLRGFDAVNFGLRKFQTVLRPAFHTANMISGMFQQAVLGTSLRNNIGGHMDAVRFMFDGDQEWIKLYDRTAASLGEARVVGRGVGKLGPVKKARKAINIVEASRRIGRTGRPLSIEEASELGLTGFLDKSHDLGDGQVLSGGELLMAFGQGELFGTFAARGFAGAPSTTGSIKALRKRGEDVFAGSKRKATEEQLRGTAEMSETVSRVAAVMGRTREGVPLHTAIEEVKDAFVDYNQLTKIERAGLKRIFTYYTFARHYVPFFMRQAAQKPGGFAKLGAAMRNFGAIGVTDGQVNARVGDVRVNLQRANANIDAMMSIPAIAERFFGAGRGPEDISGAIGTPGFLSTGGVGSIVTDAEDFFTTDNSRPRRDWLTNAVHSTFLTRWIHEGVTGTSKGFQEELLRFVAPAKTVDSNQERRTLISNYQRLLRQIQSDARETKSTWRRKQLIEEARSLSNALRDFIQQEAA